jgi:hypothetical protein
MSLRPQDIGIALLFALHPEKRWDYPSLSSAAAISLSESHGAVKRALGSKLLGMAPDGTGSILALRENLMEFLLHGMKYVFPAGKKGISRGIPTGRSAPVMAEHFAGIDDVSLVWPHPLGQVRGEAFAPLYKTAVEAALKDSALYAALALIDAIRGGSARERTLAAQLLSSIIINGKS